MIVIEIIQNIIKNTINKHFEEKETILILQNLNIKKISFSYEEIFSFLELITNCPVLTNFCNLYKEQNKSVDFDYSYEIQEKEKEISKLKEQIIRMRESNNYSIEFPPIEEKPDDYEPDVFKACEKGKLSSVQWIFERAFKNKYLDIESYGNHPIHFATMNGHLSIIQYLIEVQHIHPSLKGQGANTPLHYACESGYFEIVEYLLSKNAFIESQDCEGYTPLHLACKNGHLSIVELVYSAGANIEAQDENQNTPLHLACEGGHLPIVEFLISKGANIEAENFYRRTPLHQASYYFCADIVKYLISKGANKNAEDVYGHTPYDLGNKEIKNILEQ